MDQYRTKLVLSAVGGALIGLIGAKYLFVGSAYSLVVWAIAGLVVGYLAASYRQAMTMGSLYGFALAFIFMVTGYDGTDPLSGKLLGFAVLGIVGAICGTLWALLGQLIRHMRRGPSDVDSRAE